MKKPVTTKASAEQVVKDIRRATRKLHSSEEKIRIVLSGLRGEDNETLFAIGPRTMVERRALSQGGWRRVSKQSGGMFVRRRPKACITSGRRNFWRLARSDWLVTQPAKPILAR